MMFVSAESHENTEKLGNGNDSKTILKHHVSILIFVFYNNLIIYLFNFFKIICFICGKYFESYHIYNPSQFKH